MICTMQINEDSSATRDTQTRRRNGWGASALGLLLAILVTMTLVVPSPTAAWAQDALPADVQTRLGELDAVVYETVQSGDYPAGLEAAQEALALRLEHLGDAHVDVATTLDYVGTLSWYAGDPATALDA